MALVLTWVNRNKVLQQDVPVDHFAANVVPPEGLQSIAEWRWRADPADPWGAPTIQIVNAPGITTSYDPPGDGWVQLKAYTVLNGLSSHEFYLWEGFYLGTGLYTPGNRITDAGDNRTTDAGDTRITE